MPFVLAGVLALAGCGGGLYFGSNFDTSPPSVTLATAATSVAAGQTLRLVAAAADESGIDHVAFYRLDTNGEVLLGSDTSSPYEWVVTAPADGRTPLQVFARAVDDPGNSADSAVVSVTVTP